MPHNLLWTLEKLLNALDSYLCLDGGDVHKSKEEQFGDILISDSESIAKRMRMCFELKALNTNSAIDALNRGLLMSASSLLRHEIAYVLGQMRNRYAVRYLVNVLEDKEEDVIVRHECCEALGAIADIDTIPIVEKYCNDSAVEIAETAQLALECIKMAQSEQKIARSKYNSVDPAPSFEDISDLDTLRAIYLSESDSLFRRYRAMFTLRDIGSDEAVHILCCGLKDKSALFRHEVAFVLGQMMNEHGISELSRVLKDDAENSMVRHEAAEALGAIAKDECKAIIREHIDDHQVVVKESCIVADDLYQFWTTQT